MKKPIVLALSAPSGTGKTTVARLLAERYGFVQVITATTRPPREGEKDGVDYVFTDEETFKRWIEEGKLLEYTKIYGHLYGIPKDHIYTPLREGKNVVLSVDINGKRALERTFKDDLSVRFVSVYLMPPSLDVLRSRLKKRGDLDVDGRFKEAKKELEYAEEYDYVVINDDLERTVREIAYKLGISP